MKAQISVAKLLIITTSVNGALVREGGGGRKDMGTIPLGLRMETGTSSNDINQSSGRSRVLMLNRSHKKSSSPPPECNSVTTSDSSYSAVVAQSCTGNDGEKSAETKHTASANRRNRIDCEKYFHNYSNRDYGYRSTASDESTDNDTDDDTALSSPHIRESAEAKHTALTSHHYPKKFPPPANRRNRIDCAKNFGNCSKKDNAYKGSDSKESTDDAMDCDAAVSSPHLHRQEILQGFQGMGLSKTSKHRLDEEPTMCSGKKHKK
ncbi:unnamed protein product [Albugo candida]|uniref:RxLR effector protein n=1 Tax=Albugo candida TaxID=65357 RepID=A0A024GLY0_9STRA|nr:unnamed protein product [Albugo candida]|eukprot:CCI47875.1 unnamed protein product [Albugo candida]